MNDYEKALALHDWLTYNCRYDMRAKNRYAAEGPLLDNRAVCDGYAKAYVLLCAQAKVPCKRIVGVAGGLHAWNLVKMGGKWYQVDCTWDDPTSNIYGTDPKRSGKECYEYFGLTDKAMRWSRTWKMGTNCTSITYNHLYRNGDLDSIINGFEASIQRKLNAGTLQYKEDYYYIWQNAPYRNETVAAALSTRTFSYQGEPVRLNITFGRDKQKKYSYLIAPKPVPVTKLTFDGPPKRVKVGTATPLAYNALPANATNSAVTWSSSNKNVLTVNQNGVIKAKKVGTAVIKITAKDGSKKTSQITVKVVK